MKNKFFLIFIFVLLLLIVPVSSGIPRIERETETCSSNNYIYSIDFKKDEIICRDDGLNGSTVGSSGKAGYPPFLYNDSTYIYQNQTQFNDTVTDLIGAGGNASWNESHADNLYLLLDTSNDPLTDMLDIQLGGSIGFSPSGDTGLIVRNTGVGEDVALTLATYDPGICYINFAIPNTEDTGYIAYQHTVTNTDTIQFHTPNRDTYIGNDGLGIGTNNIDHDIHIYSSDPVIRFEESSEGDLGDIGDSKELFSVSGATDYLGIKGTSGVILGYSPTNKVMTIDSDGVLLERHVNLSFSENSWLAFNGSDMVTNSEANTSSFYFLNYSDVCDDSGNCMSGIGGGTGNASWNESHADTLYAPIGSGNASWNETYADGLYLLLDASNDPLTNDLQVQGDIHMDADNKYIEIGNDSDWKIGLLGSRLDFIYTESSTGDIWMRKQSDNGFLFRVQQAATGDIPAGISMSGYNKPFTWSGNLVGNSAPMTIAAYNGSRWHAVFQTDNVASGYPYLLLMKSGGNVYIIEDNSRLYRGEGNDTYDTFNGTDWVFESILDTTNLYFNNFSDVCDDSGNCMSDIGSGTGNASWNESHADTLYADISVTGDNSSWNESHADTLYAPIGSGNASWNETYADTLYILQSSEGDLNVNNSDYWDNMDSINTTQMEDSGGILNILESWLTTFIDNWLSGKTTNDLTEGSTNLYDNQSWNESHADTLYADISVTGDNASWNESHADTLYADISVTGDNSSWNESHADTLYSDIQWNYNQSEATFDMYNSTWDDGLTEDEVEAHIFDNDNTNHLNMSNYNITGVQCIVFQSGGSWCTA